MKCPVCHVDLQMTDRQGIEIDYCPQCRGVWLDRGELDKLIERSAISTNTGTTLTMSDRDRDRYDEREGSHRPRKKESMWRELFDFG